MVIALRSRPPFTGVLLGPGPESAPRSAFWAILGTCLGVPQRVPFECFLAFLGPKNPQKALKKHSLGHSEAGAQNCPKSRALSGPGPKSTPVNGGQDRNHSDQLRQRVWRCFFLGGKNGSKSVRIVKHYGSSKTLRCSAPQQD